MQIDQKIVNLQEQLLFERAYYRRREEEWKMIEKISSELNRTFDQSESEQIIERIR